jgi:glycosyltransferase involved in cell wall biosynthesis
VSRQIEIVTNDGSPIGVCLSDLWGGDWRVGLGGAETALVTMCEAWAKRGDEVILYNDPHPGGNSPFEQRPILAFHPHDEHDIVIFFRSPPIQHPIFLTTTGLKVWWSCDQQTVGDFSAFSKTVDRIVCISDFHQQFFMRRYGIANTVVIDLPVRVEDFAGLEVERVSKRVIFTSVPARGLDNLHRMWGRILSRVPEATLVITSDYRLWGVGASNEQFRVKWARQNNVTYFGALARKQYLEELLKADLYFYPSEYDELFCIAAAEAQVAGCQSITSATGALPTTNMGCVIGVDASNTHNDMLFIDRAVEMLRAEQRDDDLREKAIQRFHPDTILQQWDTRVFG